MQDQTFNLSKQDTMTNQKQSLRKTGPLSGRKEPEDFTDIS